MKKLIVNLCLLAFSSCFVFQVSASTENNTNTEESDDFSIGGKNRREASPASKKALSRQTKRAQRSIKQNHKRNKQYLKHRGRKQKKQKRFSRKDTFR